jgi:nucleoside-diphosphate-sugar epimerase
MKILLTGATGFLGFRTLEKLKEIDNIEKIVANGRNLKLGHIVIDNKIDYQFGDLSDRDLVAKLVQNIDIIIHAAALSSPWGKYEDFNKSNILSIENLIYAALKNNVKRFIFISSPSIYFELKDRLNIKESDPLPSGFINYYAETKYQAEKKLESSGLQYIILRPRAIIGRGDTVIMPRLIKAYDKKKLFILGDGKNIVDLTSVSNIVNAIILSINSDEKSLNNSYNITNGKPVALWEAISNVLTSLNRTIPNKKININVLMFLASLMELKAKLFGGREPVLTRYTAGTLGKSFTMDISKAKELLGYIPLVTTEESIEEFVKWYRQNEKNQTSY